MPVKPVGQFKVGKSFVCEGVLLESGTVVDVTGWRNARILIERRYLIPIGKISVTSVETSKPDPVVDVKEVVESCPKCGAVGDEPCLSASGRPTPTHAGRNV